MQWQVFPLSEEAILLECDQSTPIQTIHICSKQIEEILGEDLLDIVTAYHSITVFSKFSMDELIQTLNGSIRQIAENKNEDSSSAIRIPICYDFAMDLDRIAVHTKFSKDEIIERHISATYQAIVLGFTPGFVYAEGLDQALSCPRLSNPRSSLPAGSVGIGGNQTGIYSLASPGGWNIIGRTPMKLFDKNLRPPMKLALGATYQFFSISKDEFESWES